MPNYNVIIIGAGPAGMSAALYLGRSKQKTLLLEKGTPGGRMLQATDISNFSGVKSDSGTNIAVTMFSQIDFNNVDFRQEEVLEVIENNEKTNFVRRIYLSIKNKIAKFDTDDYCFVLFGYFIFMELI